MRGRRYTSPEELSTDGIRSIGPMNKSGVFAWNNNASQGCDIDLLPRVVPWET